MNKQRGLGKGSLGKGTGDRLARTGGMTAFIKSIEKRDTRYGDSELLKIDISSIEPNPYQPRKQFPADTIKALSESILAKGILQPIIVRKNNKDGFQIVAGERRWRAAALAGINTIPAIVRQVSDRDSAMYAVIENIQREELNPIEEAFALNSLIKEHGATHEDIASMIGRSRSAVTNSLRLLTLTKEVKTFLSEKLLDQGHARTLVPLNEKQQLQVASEIIKHKLSVRQAEKLAQGLLKQTEAKTKPTTKNFILSSDSSKLENAISNELQAKVSISHNKNFKGTISFHFNNNDSFIHILHKLGLKRFL
ncbi:MAG: ParB/RepB/Spo0J family partition protein [Methylacidiphilales bacterium]|nr:ParB/RepB/Spo0J family partition protein [Candidatus Methylacidiphilales bacterium]